MFSTDEIRSASAIVHSLSVPAAPVRFEVELPGRDARPRSELGHDVDHQPVAVAGSAPAQRDAIALLQHAAR